MRLVETGNVASNKASGDVLTRNEARGTGNEAGNEAATVTNLAA